MTCKTSKHNGKVRMAALAGLLCCLCTLPVQAASGTAPASAAPSAAVSSAAPVPSSVAPPVSSAVVVSSRVASSAVPASSQAPVLSRTFSVSSAAVQAVISSSQTPSSSKVSSSRASSSQLSSANSISLPSVVVASQKNRFANPTDTTARNTAVNGIGAALWVAVITAAATIFFMAYRNRNRVNAASGGHKRYSDVRRDKKKRLLGDKYYHDSKYKKG